MRKILILALIMVALSACASGGSSNRGITVSEIPAEYQGWTNPLSGADAVAAGGNVYQVNCTACHGETGAGDGPASASLVPPPVNFHELYSLAGEDYYYFVIREGVPGTSMVSWKNTLTDEEVMQVIAYVREFK